MSPVKKTPHNQGRLSFGVLKTSPRIRLKASVAAIDKQDPHHTADEFAHFEALTAGLVKVPKSEVDEKRKKS